MLLEEVASWRWVCAEQLGVSFPREKNQGGSSLSVATSLDPTRPLRLLGQ